jgi:hypothetical protein
VTVITPGTGSSITSTTTVSIAGMLGGVTGFVLFRTIFFVRARLGLALPKCFIDAGLATPRLIAFPRADLKALRALRCVVVFRALFFL